MYNVTTLNTAWKCESRFLSGGNWINGGGVL